MKRFVAALLFAALALAPLLSQEDKLRDRYYKKWLDEDVVYIISDDERAVFSKLSTPEEKDAFIEQFWQRRSPHPTRSANEYKEEHYRRIAHANDRFASGMPGWKTDRGRIYIMFGPPVEIEEHSGGAHYYRKPYEGGGSTTTYPFQVWRYRHIEGIGDDIEIEFVDQSWTGLYKMVMTPWEKDLLLHVDGEGQTFGERVGLTKRNYRPGLHPGYLNDATMMNRYGFRSKDTPFEKMLQYFQLQRPPVIKQKELQTIVQTRVSYNRLPFLHALSYVYMDPEKALVPITMEIDNKNLTYRQEGTVQKARVGLYGAVTSIAGKIVAEFEDTIASEYTPDRFEFGQTQKSMYQRPVLVPAGLHKVDFVVKDLHSGTIGSLQINLNVPKLKSEGLAMSPIILAKILQPMDTFPDAPQTFVIGDLKVVPNVARKFRPEDHLNVYFQIYNMRRDESDLRPRFETRYTILDDKGTQVTQLLDQAGTSIEYSSEARTVMARRIGVKPLVPGAYRLKIEVSDLLAGQKATQETRFEMIAP